MQYCRSTLRLKPCSLDDVQGGITAIKVGDNVKLTVNINGIDNNYRMEIITMSGESLNLTSMDNGIAQSYKDNNLEFYCKVFKRGKLIATAKTDGYKSVDKYSSSLGFEGNVATYNYYEKELPEVLANDASKIIEAQTVESDSIDNEQATVVENIPSRGTIAVENAEPINEISLYERQEIEKVEEKLIGKKFIRSSQQGKSAMDGEEMQGKFEAKYYLDNKSEFDELFKKFPRDEYLSKIIPSSTWVKVDYDERKSYSVGLLTDGENVRYIGYAVFGMYSSEPPKELNSNAQWIPLDFSKSHDKGYWLIYQSAVDGN